MKNLLIVLTICFSLCCVCGCITTGKGEFPLPQKPQTQKVNFEQVDNGYFLTNEEAKKLADNVDELKAYIEKLELLVDAMNKHYGK
jgi:outer membrane murein-binding lipoprotein Lpp